MLTESASSTTIKQHCHTVTTPVIFYARLISNSFPALNENEEFSCWYTHSSNERSTISSGYSILWPMANKWKYEKPPVKWDERDALNRFKNHSFIQNDFENICFPNSHWAFQTCHSWIKKDFQVPSTMHCMILFNGTKLCSWFSSVYTFFFILSGNRLHFWTQFEHELISTLKLCEWMI